MADWISEHGRCLLHSRANLLIFWDECGGLECLRYELVHFRTKETDVAGWKAYPTSWGHDNIEIVVEATD